MDVPYGNFEPNQADQLAALWAQRKRILLLTADIRDAKLRLSMLDPSEFWSSSAQRAYRERIAEIVHDVQGVLNHLITAQDQIWRNIRQLQAAGEE
ncbi:hypothetical protein E3O25_10635 [Cryobacterium sp. TMT1-3]|uniref:hypothetical protein n=1 Tax=Cryobacterium sp. TMT1-3 TaxID=1259237 RepID=UPI00106C87DD|nr:hypothetical protein [Cryobacterium sp. TMT1-3]TFC26851.1 hypothetical protein E3O25_10635 [Cryobacterium sp. TMT1-3]